MSRIIVFIVSVINSYLRSFLRTTDFLKDLSWIKTIKKITASFKIFAVINS